MLEAALLAGCLSGMAAAESVSGGSFRLAGNYISFEQDGDHVKAVLKQGILTVEDGRITKITPDEGQEADVIRLDDSCVIYPGLLDLHSHVEYNFFQLWQSDENRVPWDNRFEWRRAASERADLYEKEVKITDQWEDPLDKTKDALTGDLIEYFTEMQAAAGGTTLIQGYNDTDAYDTADSHRKVRLIRDTCSAQDLGVDEGKEVTCLIQIYKPDAEILSDDPQTYLPPIDTSAWNVTEQVNDATGQTCLEEILNSIEEGTASGYLIHIAEGRAGVHLPAEDSFVSLEFSSFKEAIRNGVREGRFTAEDVRNAHIGLIHACAVDLGDEDDYRFIKEFGIGVLWAPVSNLMLYGDTPDFYNYFGDEEVLVGIGSDWSPSGSKSVWDECRFAYTYMQKHAADPENIREKLLRACTFTAAKIINNPYVGNIAPGGFADLFILRGKEPVGGNLDKALEMFTDTDDGGVEAVVVGGRAVYGERDLLADLTGDEELESYGTYDSGVEALSDKYFYLPRLFGGMNFEEAYKKYTGILEEAGIEMSRLRGLEDPYYRTFLDELQQQY